MVALVDTLESRGLVERSRSPRDRRKNIVALTAEGRGCLRQAERAREDAERRFLAPLGPAEADALISALRVLAGAPR
jgi:DNA-binding MarR family transcriptional regulator